MAQVIKYECDICGKDTTNEKQYLITVENRSSVCISINFSRYIIYMDGTCDNCSQKISVAINEEIGSIKEAMKNENDDEALESDT